MGRVECVTLNRKIEVGLAVAGGVLAVAGTVAAVYFIRKRPGRVTTSYVQLEDMSSEVMQRWT